MKTFKKVWRYIRRYKKLLTISILAMLVVQVLGLLAPLIVKSILDDYLIGIEEPWYVTTLDQSEVTYNGIHLTQEPNDNDIYSVFIYQGKYYLFNGLINEGHRQVTSDGTTHYLSIEGITVGEIVRLENQVVKSFYEPFVQPLIILIVLLAVRFFLQILFTYIQRISTSMLNVNIVRDARKDAIKALQNMPMTYFESEPAGKIANRIIHDVGGMMNLFSTLMNLVLNASLAVVFAYIGMFYLDAKLALLTFVVFPIIYVWLKYFVGKLNKIAVKVNEQNSMITANLNEIIKGISIL